MESDDRCFGEVLDALAIDGHDVRARIDAARRPEHGDASDLDATFRYQLFGLLARADAELRESARQRDGGARLQRAIGSPSANAIWPSHTSFPSTSARPLRLPILLRMRTTSASSRTWSPATTGRR